MSLSGHLEKVVLVQEVKIYFVEKLSLLSIQFIKVYILISKHQHDTASHSITVELQCCKHKNRTVLKT